VILGFSSGAFWAWAVKPKNKSSIAQRNLTPPAPLSKKEGGAR